MQVPLEIVFHNMDHSDAIENRVRERAGRLGRFNPNITSCHVYVEAQHRSPQHKVKSYQVRIEARVPGTELAARGKPNGNHNDIYLAIRSAFDAMERQLKRRRSRVTGTVKAHAAPLQGTVSELYPERSHGQIATTDGRLVYFHRNSVVGDGFAKLSEGDPVELTVQTNESEKGPQASTVRPIGAMRFVAENH